MRSSCLAVMQLHCDSVREKVPESASLHCLGDAGFFIDHESVNGRSVYRESMTYAFRLHNATASVNKECVATKADDLAWMCMFADYSLPHIHTPFFMVRMCIATLLVHMRLCWAGNSNTASGCHATHFLTVKFELRLMVDGLYSRSPSLLYPLADRVSELLEMHHRLCKLHTTVEGCRGRLGRSVSTENVSSCRCTKAWLFCQQLSSSSQHRRGGSILNQNQWHFIGGRGG